MSDCVWWERVSAGVDGELTAPEVAAAEAHAATCPTCASALRATTALRAPLRPVAPLESRSAFAFDRQQLTSEERRWFGGRWARRLLILASVVIVAEALPGYIRGDTLEAGSHAARHLAAWQIGFGVGLFVAAWVARLSHAMLSLAATFASLTVVATVIDVVGGHQGALTEWVHVVEVIAVVLLWRLTPPHLLPWHRSPDSYAAGASESTARDDLRLVTNEPGEPDPPR